jgi:hypothetical protein
MKRPLLPEGLAEWYLRAANRRNPWLSEHITVFIRRLFPSRCSKLRIPSTCEPLQLGAIVRAKLSHWISDTQPIFI